MTKVSVKSRVRRVHFEGGAGYNNLVRTTDVVFSDYFETNFYLSGVYEP